jgi:hypothetical protein
MSDIQNKSTMFAAKQKGTDRKPFKKYRRLVISIFVGVLISLVGIIYNDSRYIDQTSGGYTYPYTDYTGEPYNYDDFELNSVGFRNTNGLILEYQINCTTGMITGFLGPIAIDYRVLSDRAVVIHKPQLACKEKGFTPEWKY